jgi:hypothetical protein
MALPTFAVSGLIAGSGLLGGTTVTVLPSSLVDQTHELQISGAADRTQVRYPGQERITFTITLRTGPRDLGFLLMWRPSVFTTERAGIRTTEGATMRREVRQVEGGGFAPPFTLTGDATAGNPGGVSGQPGCSPIRNMHHGVGQGMSNVPLTMPANANATVQASYITGDDAPWPGDEHQLTIQAIPIPGHPSTLTQPMTVKTDSVAVRGTTGTRIMLASSPSSYISGSINHRNVTLGTTLRVRGRTEPALRNGTITLRHVVPNSRSLRTLAKIRTDKRGRFVHRWKPKSRGIHELWAFSPSARNRAADHTCPIAIRVTGNKRAPRTSR